MGLPEWERSAAVDKYVAELRSEVGKLKEKMTALTKERDELLWALQWNTGKLADSEYLGENIRQGARRALEIERKYATTAPTSTGA